MKYFVFFIFIICILFFVLFPFSARKEISNSRKSKQRKSEHALGFSAKKTNNIREKLATTRLENTELKNCSIPDAIAKLRIESKNAVNIVYIPARNNHAPMGESISDDKQIEKDFKKHITINLNNPSLGEAIRKLCAAGDLHYKIDDNAILIADKHIPLVPLQTRFYPINSHKLRLHDDEGGDSSVNSVKVFFEKRGILFPNGATIEYNALLSRLIVTNTPKQLTKIKRIIDDINSANPQIYITTRFIKIPEAEFRKIKNSNADNTCMKILLSSHTEIIASATILSQNGVESTVRMGKDIFYPDSWTEWQVLDNCKDNENKDDNEQKKAQTTNSTLHSHTKTKEYLPPTPDFSDVTELGIRLTATPCIEPDRYSIVLDADPVLQYFSGWTKYGKLIKMPILHKWTTISSEKLHDGETIMLSSFVETVPQSGNDTVNRFILMLSARIVKPDGEDLWGKSEILNPRTNKVAEQCFHKKIDDSNPESRSMIMPQIHFRNLNIREATGKLAKIIAAHNKNITIILDLPDNEIESIPSINLELTDIRLKEVIKYISFQTGLKYTFDDNRIIMGNKSTYEMSVQFFKVASEFIFKVLSNPSEERNPEYAELKNKDSNATQSQKLKKYFMERGVTFPHGSEISYNSMTGKLRMKNTKKNLISLKGLFSYLYADASRIEIESTIIEIDNKDLIQLLGKKAALNDNFTKPQIEKIITSPKSKITTAQSISTISGNEAELIFGDEMSLPQSWKTQKMLYPDGSHSKFSSMPEFEDPEIVGSNLTATPSLFTDNYTIGLNLTSKHRQLTGWYHYDIFSKILKKNGRTNSNPEMSVKMPVIDTKSLITNLKTYSGAIIMVARTQLIDTFNKDNNATTLTELLKNARKNKHKLKNIFFFIQADIGKNK